MKNKKQSTLQTMTGAERLQKMTASRNEIAAVLLGRPLDERGVSMSGVAKQFSDALKSDIPLSRGDKARRMKRVLDKMFVNAENWRTQDNNDDNKT